MIWAVVGESEFYTTDHLQSLREENRDGQKIRYDANNAKLGRIVDNLYAPNRRLMLRTKHMGFWMNLQVTAVTDIALADMEYCDFVRTLRCYPP